MEMMKLKGSARQARGSREAQRLRRQGKMPGILYGHGQTPQAVAVVVDDLEHVLEHHSPIIELDVDGQPHSVLIKDVQFDQIGIKPVHVDFMRVDLNEQVRVSVALEYKGTPAGTQEGGIFEGMLVDLEVETLASSIPESIRINVADLQVGQFIQVKDVALPPGVKALSPADTIVCTVRAKLVEEVVEAAPTEEVPAQPEIITARKPAEEGEEEEKKEKK